MIKSKLITEPTLFKIYQNHYLALAQNNVDLKYLQNSAVRVFFEDSAENMLAGYCINSGPDYRTFLPLNTTQLHNLQLKCGFENNMPHEITCLWIDKNIRSKACSGLVFYKMLMDVLHLKSGATTIFGTHGKNIKDYYTPAFPETIFNERLFVETKNKECDFWIMKGSKATFLKCFVFNMPIRVIFGNKLFCKFRVWVQKNKSDTSS